MAKERKKRGDSTILRANAAKSMIEVSAKAHPRRGENFEDAARAFIKEFPLDTGLTNIDFDEWIWGQGLAPRPTSQRRGSDPWVAHVFRRNQIRQGINLAATHPRLKTNFVIELRGSGRMKVTEPRQLIEAKRLLTKIESIMRGEKRKIEYYIQGTDWANTSELNLIECTLGCQRIDEFLEFVKFAANQLDAKMASIEKAVSEASKRRNGILPLSLNAE